LVKGLSIAGLVHADEPLGWTELAARYPSVDDLGWIISILSFYPWTRKDLNMTDDHECMDGINQAENILIFCGVFP
jgi:hypothetical protein